MNDFAQTDAVPSTVVQNFSLFAGGPLYRIARRLGFARAESTLPRLGIALALLTWTPLAALAGLTAVDGLAPGRVVVPFLVSLGTHARFLVAIPLFFAAEAWIGPRLGNFLGQIVESQLVPQEDVPSLDAAVAGAMRLRDSVIAVAGGVGLITGGYVTVATPPMLPIVQQQGHEPDRDHDQRKAARPITPSGSGVRPLSSNWKNL